MKDLGLKCGIEIHQQLEGRKLFSQMGSEIDEKPTGNVNRFLRAVAGETGEVDLAAKAEMMKGRRYTYEYSKDSDSLIELDESPPLSMNDEALATTLQFCSMVNARVVDRIEIMRKTVVDGSNTSGFQRTALVARNGVLRTPECEISIPTVMIEEDAARIISQNEDGVTYRLDRLGTPLMEISTGPDMRTPQQVADVAERIGMLLRSTGKVKRGLGTIRQDVNVSISGGRRVEIKGAQDLRMLSTLVENEAKRQQALIEIAKELANTNQGKPDIKDVSSLFSGSINKIISGAMQNGGGIFGILLPGAGILGKETQPGKRYGTELSDRAKIAAGVKGIIHSDEDLSKYAILPDQVVRIRTSLSCGDKDAFVLVAATEARARMALEAVAERHVQARDGVPSEVRKAHEDGTTSYLRPMPGAARLYPETDIPPIVVDKKSLQSIEIPETIEERAARYMKLGLSKDVADLAAKSSSWKAFDEFVKQFTTLKPAYIAEVVFASAATIKRMHGVSVNPSTADFEALLSALAEGKVAKESVLDILKTGKPVAETLANFKIMDDAELEKAIDGIIAANPGKTFNALIGIVMGKLRGKASGQKISEILKKKAP